MNKNTFDLINAINCEEIENFNWGIVKNIKSTKKQFGTKEDVELKGIWLYVYDDGNLSRWFKSMAKDTMSLEIKEEYNILLYKA